MPSTQNSAVVNQLARSGCSKISNLLYAEQIILARVRADIEERKRDGASQQTPTIQSAVSTHNFVLAKQFRPSLNIAIEYTERVETADLGSQVRFTYRPDTDYINDAFLTLTLPTVSCTLATLPNIVVSSPYVSAALGSNPLDFGTGSNITDDQARGNYTMIRNGFVYTMTGPGVAAASTPVVVDGVTYYLKPAAYSGSGGVGSISYTYVDSRGRFLAGPDGYKTAPTADGFGGGQTGTNPKVQAANWVRAAVLHGVKALSTSTFLVDDNLIETYEPINVLDRRDFMMNSARERLNFDRLVQASTPVQYAGRVTSGRVNGFTGGVTNPHQEFKSFSSGPSIPQPMILSHDVTVPLQFQHNLGRANSLPVCTIPEADIHHQFDLARLDQIFYPAPGAVFIEERVKLYSSDAAATGTILAPRQEIYRLIPVIVPGSVVQQATNNRVVCKLTQCNLYVDTILHLCLLSRVYFHLIRRYYNFKLVTTGEEEAFTHTLDRSKFPIEWITLHESPLPNNDGRSHNNATDWCLNGHVRRQDVSQYLNRTEMLAGGDYVSRHTIVDQMRIPEVTPVVRRLGVTVDDNVYYPLANGSFYTDYLPYNLTNGLLSSQANTPCPRKFVSFSHRPGDSQSFGHQTSSRNSEIGLVFDTAPIPVAEFEDGVQGPDTRYITSLYVKSQVTAACASVNFLLGSDGTYSIRFQ